MTHLLSACRALAHGAAHATQAAAHGPARPQDSRQMRRASGSRRVERKPDNCAGHGGTAKTSRETLIGGG